MSAGNTNMKEFLIVYKTGNIKESVIITAHNVRDAINTFKASYPAAKIESVTYYGQPS